MRRASRLNETGRPARASSTTTPTGEVSTRASRSARARRSRRCVRALVIAAAALGREQRQHLLVVVGERLAVGLLGEEEIADVGAPDGAAARPGRCERTSARAR